jgi:hypothetical protein
MHGHHLIGPSQKKLINHFDNNMRCYWEHVEECIWNNKSPKKKSTAHPPPKRKKKKHWSLGVHAPWITSLASLPQFFTTIARDIGFFCFGLAYRGKDIVFRFIIEYISLWDFGP